MNIKELRKKKGMSQLALAVAVGVSLTTIRLWESGATTPTDTNMAALKRALL